MTKNTVDKSMILGDIVKKYPKAAVIMMEYGLHCIGCHVASWESIEQGASGHGLDSDEIDRMVDDINKAINETGKTAARHTSHPNSM